MPFARNSCMQTIAFAMLRFCVDSFNDRAELKTNEAATNGAYGFKKTGGTQNMSAACLIKRMCRHLDSNQGPPPCQGDTLTN